MKGRFRPQRSLRSELSSLVCAAAVPALLYLSFPSEALLPLPPAPEPASKASCAFVTLTPEEERKALAAARAAWQIDRGSDRRMSIDLFAASLPPLPPRAALGILSRPRVEHCVDAPYAPDPLPPTLAAPLPATIAPQPDANAATPTFSREELLKLN